VKLDVKNLHLTRNNFFDSHMYEYESIMSESHRRTKRSFRDYGGNFILIEDIEQILNLR